jgi:DNA-binding NarL/FixJ family response regulator
MGLANLGTLSTLRGDYAIARDRLRASVAIFEELADTTSTAAMLDRFAQLEAAQGHHERALLLAGAAAGQRSAEGALLSAASQKKLDARLAAARQALGEAGIAAWCAGQNLSLSDAVAAVLNASSTHAGAVEPVRSVQSVPSQRAASTGLTAREQDVAALIGRGLTNRQIGAALVITEGTVASHVVHILDKLGYRSRAQIAVWAAEQGLVDKEATRAAIS